MFFSFAFFLKGFPFFVSQPQIHNTQQNHQKTTPPLPTNHTQNTTNPQPKLFCQIVVKAPLLSFLILSLL